MKFLGILGLIFITLKLTGYVGWAWWVVLSPLWGGFILWVVAALLSAYVYLKSQEIINYINQWSKL